MHLQNFWITMHSHSTCYNVCSCAIEYPDCASVFCTSRPTSDSQARNLKELCSTHNPEQDAPTLLSSFPEPQPFRALTMQRTTAATVSSGWQRGSPLQPRHAAFSASIRSSSSNSLSVRLAFSINSSSDNSSSCFLDAVCFGFRKSSCALRSR